MACRRVVLARAHGAERPLARHRDRQSRPRIRLPPVPGAATRRGVRSVPGPAGPPPDPAAQRRRAQRHRPRAQGGPRRAVRLAGAGGERRRAVAGGRARSRHRRRGARRGGAARRARGAGADRLPRGAGGRRSIRRSPSCCAPSSVTGAPKPSPAKPMPARAPAWRRSQASPLLPLPLAGEGRGEGRVARPRAFCPAARRAADRGRDRLPARLVPRRPASGGLVRRR